jgi:ornithine cyclodeaminase
VHAAGVPVDFLYLSQEDVVAAGGTDMPAVIDVVEGAFRLKAEGQVVNPPKVMLTWSDEPGTQERDGRIMAMPAWVGGEWDVAGMKWIPSVPANPARGMPRANAIVLPSDRETGLPVAVMDGTIVSAMRTGAVTGVAIRHLARPDARTAGLLGAGVLTRTQLMALAATLPALVAVRLYDPDGPRAQRLAAELAPSLPFPLVVAGSEREACEGADVIVPSTLATRESTLDVEGSTNWPRSPSPTGSGTRPARRPAVSRPGARRRCRPPSARRSRPARACAWSRPGTRSRPST